MIIATYAPTYARMGIPILALIPRDKYPVKAMTGWADISATNPYGEIATTDLGILEQWDKDWPDSNYALAAFPHVGSACFLEFDQGTLEEMCQQFNQSLPVTRTHISGGGGTHYVFLHTEKSIEIGNRYASRDEHEWFSFRGYNYYVLGPGSIHPNGNIYKVGTDINPAPIPDWLVAAVESQTVTTKSKKPDFCLEVDEGFDFDDFCFHYEISIRGIKDDVWHVVEECPGAGHRHEHSVFTAFYYDGSSFGWNCFAGGCPASSLTIGGLIKLLNETYDPYLEPIWPEQPITRILDQFGVDYDNDIEEAKPAPEPPNLSSLKSLDDALEEYAAFLNPDALPPPAEPLKLVDPDAHTGLAFPGDCAMYGKLKEIAHRFPRLQLGWFYPSLLAVASSLEIRERNHHVRPNIYLANLGDKGFGKSVCSDVAVRCFYQANEAGEINDDVVIEETPSSDRGLLNMLDEECVVSRILWLDEMRTMLSKCAIQNSALPQMICTLWYRTKVGCSDKKARQVAYGKLSIIGNIACKDTSDFAALFGSSTVDGMADRFLFGYADTWVKYRPNDIVAEQIDVSRPVSVPAWVWDAKDEWGGDDPDRRRMTEHVLRVALVTAAVNGDSEITAPCLEAAFRFCEWQLRIRSAYHPGIAETKEAQCFEAVYEALREALDQQEAKKITPKVAEKLMIEMPRENRWKLLHFAQIVNNKSYYRRFAGLIDRVRKTMIDSGIIRVVYETAPDDGSGKSSPKRHSKNDETPFVILQGRIK